MKINLKDIVDKESEKIAMVTGLGPSLREVLPGIEDMSKNNRDKVAFYSCNFFDSMTKIITDYWFVCNSQGVMKVATAHKRYNAQPNSIFLSLERIPGFKEEELKKHLKVDYIPLNEKNDLSLLLMDYTSTDKRYGAVFSVIIHQIATAIVTGCKEIYISGVDLDYSGGYAKPGVHQKGVSLGKINMNSEARRKTLASVEILKECANKVGSELYCLNKKSPLRELMDYRDINEIKKKLDK